MADEPKQNCTPEEKEQRLAIVRAMVMRGLPQAEIVNTCLKEQTWGVTPRMIRYYIKDVWDDMGYEALGVDRAAEAVLAKDQLNLIIGEAIKKGEYKAATDAILAKIKLWKLDSPNAAAKWEDKAKAAGFNPEDVVKAFLKEAQGNELPNT